MEKSMIYKKGLGFKIVEPMHHFSFAAKYSEKMKCELSKESPRNRGAEFYGYDGLANYHNYEMALSSHDNWLLETFYEEGFVRVNLYEANGFFGEITCSDLQFGIEVAEKVFKKYPCKSIEIIEHNTSGSYTEVSEKHVVYNNNN